MSHRDAPRVFVSYAHDSTGHRDEVRRFAEFLRAVIGMDVRLDQWDDGPRRDWSLWAVEQLAEADFVLVVASPAYRRRTDWDAPEGDGWGARFEAAIIRDNLTRDLPRETERMLPVLLPGRTIEDIPVFLNAHSTTWFRVDHLTRDGVSDLVAAITGQGRYPMPDRGPWQREAEQVGPVPVAGGLAWTASGAGVLTASASIGGARYTDSIVFRPRTPGRGFVDVDLGGRFQWLTTVAGVLDDAEPFQVGLFRVHVDGTQRVERRVAWGEVAAIEVDVAGARSLRLEMSRPGTTTGNLLTGGLPALAWGDPTLVGP